MQRACRMQIYRRLQLSPKLKEVEEKCQRRGFFDLIEVISTLLLIIRFSVSTLMSSYIALLSLRENYCFIINERLRDQRSTEKFRIKVTDSIICELSKQCPCYWINDHAILGVSMHSK